MRAVIQRTFNSKLYVENKLISEIPSGLTIFIGITEGDTFEQAKYFAQKMAKLRVFRDENGKMNLNIQQAGGEILLVSQFSLAGTLGKGTGNRPDFIKIIRKENDNFDLTLRKRRFCNAKEPLLPCKSGSFGT